MEGYDWTASSSTDDLYYVQVSDISEASTDAYESEDQVIPAGQPTQAVQAAQASQDSTGLDPRLIHQRTLVSESESAGDMIDFTPLAISSPRPSNTQDPEAMDEGEFESDAVHAGLLNRPRGMRSPPGFPLLPQQAYQQAADRTAAWVAALPSTRSVVRTPARASATAVSTNPAVSTTSATSAAPAAAAAVAPASTSMGPTRSWEEIGDQEWAQCKDSFNAVS